ncbi:MAG: hypothetical protein ACYC2T_15125 [Bacillota bacterium]
MGALHGADTDHVVEMTVFVTHDPRTRRVMSFALKFGGGHNLTVLLVGMTVQLVKGVVPEVFNTIGLRLCPALRATMDSCHLLRPASGS